MSETYNLMKELTLLSPGAVRLFLDEFEELYLAIDSKKPVGPLTVHRAFPISAPGDFVTLRNRQGAEVGIVRRVADLDRASRAVLKSELDRTYFGARITSINAIEIEYHVPHWDVETDRGSKAFELHSTRRDIRVLDGGRILITDADGNRYEIPDYRRLDSASRALVEAQI